MANVAVSRRRSRPLRVERDDVLLFITSRTVEERFWLHPLLSCAAKPRNRHARRVVAALGRNQRRRYARLAEEANARSVLDANFDQRPKRSKTTRRPYCFGSRRHRAVHYQEMSALHELYADSSERYLGGQRDVGFPPGTYPPPVLAAAT